MQSISPLSRSAGAKLAGLILAGVLLAACHSNPDRDRPENPFKTQKGPGAAQTPLTDRELRIKADELYRRAHKALTDSDFSTAITRYDQLNARYPFSDYATQAELEKIYAQYKSYQADEALSGADRFLRAHPRNPDAEYVQYLKGLISFSRDQSITESIGIDSTRKDVSNLRRSFGDFALLLQRYPDSKYAGDARRRMVYMRNRIANHELSIVKYYMRRGAYIAASRRAEDIISEYPGAPATKTALVLLQQADSKAGLTEQAADAANIIAANASNLPTPAAPPVREKRIGTFEDVPPPLPDAAADKDEPKSPGLLARTFHRIGSWFPFLHPNRHDTTLTAPVSPSPEPDPAALPTPAPPVTETAPVTTPPAETVPTTEGPGHSPSPSPAAPGTP